MSRRALRAMVLAAVALLGGCALFRSPTYVADADDPAVPDGTPLVVGFAGDPSIAEFRLRRTIEDRIYDLSRAPDSEAVLQDALFDLEDRFRNDGFADVQVRGRVRPAEPGSDVREVLFTVDEGPRWFLGERRLRGADRLDRTEREQLDELLLRRYADTFGLDEPLFVQADIDGWASSIAIYLKSRGYLDAQVRPATLTRRADDAEVDVELTIVPGPRYRFGTVSLTPELAAVLPPDDRPEPPAAGEPAVATRIEDHRAEVLRALRHVGRPEAVVRTALARRDGAPLVDVEIGGEPGPSATVAEVRVVGLADTRRSVVTERLGFERGARYDGDEIGEALRELYRTGLFRSVEIDHRWLDEQPTGADGRGPVQMLVEVEERDSRTLEALLGYGSYERARGKLRFEERNLFGTGKALALETRVSTRGERGLAQITDPAFLGSRNALSLSADVYRREWPTFEDEAWGGTIAVTRDLLERLTARVGYTLRLHTDAEDRALGRSTELGDYVEGAVFFEARYDQRNNLLYPSEGYQVSLRVERNDDALGADIEFLRAQIDLGYYAPLSRRAVLAFRADIGAIWPEDGTSLVPLQERFFNGGENTVRSFREFQLGPKDTAGRPLGGEYRSIFGVELRSRIGRLLETSLFVDAGNVGVSVDDLSFDDMRYAIGAGLRIPLPIGPVRFDAAWNPDRQVGEREWTLHISVGYPF